MVLALYRRYRPDTFSHVIGQDQVTIPLSRAIDNGKIAQAYLFSGPRGCGKTSSARILARCLNCEKGPTSHPCGVCASCRELSADGKGSIDVVEIDAASHNGVDDAREIRERAQFAPARDRYKIFILDEAHMVTQQGFNALLKIVEEPPEHVIFIFATTEPDKVISTIRSRTRHYPFRLVPAEIMLPHLETICHKEKVTVEPGVLNLVLRAGEGSVRDTLSVLDQLIAGSENNTISYDMASLLLGFTPEALINDTVTALGTQNGENLYTAIEKVVLGGYEPSRFIDDLLERFRDLLMIMMAGKTALTSFTEEKRVENTDILTEQAQLFTLDAISRCAEATNTALVQLGTSISTRMTLELLAVQLLAIMPSTSMPTLAPTDSQQTTLRTVQQEKPLPSIPTVAPQAHFIPSTPVTPPLRMPVITPPIGDTKQQLWRTSLTNIPQELSQYVNTTTVPTVAFSQNALGGTHIILTFDTPLSQHIFAMAHDTDGHSIPSLVQRHLRDTFGPRTSIAPNTMAANGEVVHKISEMTPQEQVATQQAIAAATRLNTTTALAQNNTTETPHEPSASASDTSTPTINISTSTWNNIITPPDVTQQAIPPVPDQESETPHISTPPEQHAETTEPPSPVSSSNDTEDDYSLKDQSLDSVQSLTLDDLKTMFSVKKETIITNTPTTDKQ